MKNEYYLQHELKTIRNQQTKRLGITIYFLAIVILAIDYFFTHEFMQEGIFFTLSILALVSQIVVLSIDSLEKSNVKFPLGFVLLVLNGYCSAVLCIMCFGFGFTGKSMTYNMISAYPVNLLIYFYLWKHSLRSS